MLKLTLFLLLQAAGIAGNAPPTLPTDCLDDQRLVLIAAENRFACSSGRTTYYRTPSTGATISLLQAREVTLLLDPAGTLATLTINMPSSPSNDDRVTIASSQIITVFTLGNGTITGALTTLSAGGFATYQFSSSGNKWFRVA